MNEVHNRQRCIKRMRVNQCQSVDGCMCAVVDMQVCISGRVQHLEHLLFYGADINAQNTSGDTPLHVCAKYNQVLRFYTQSRPISVRSRSETWSNLLAFCLRRIILFLPI